MDTIRPKDFRLKASSLSRCVNVHIHTCGRRKAGKAPERPGRKERNSIRGQANIVFTLKVEAVMGITGDAAGAESSHVGGGDGDQMKASPSH